VKAAIKAHTILITIMYANNEIGVTIRLRNRQDRQGTRHLLRRGRRAGRGKIPVDVQKDNIDLLAISGHKIYGPKGVCALYVRRRNPRVQLSAIIDGGGHERGIAFRTLNVARHRRPWQGLRDCTEGNARRSGALACLAHASPKGLEAKLDEVFINGSMEHRLPNNLNMSFAYVEGESLLMGINDIAVSSGSACTSATLEPSYVLKAIRRRRRPRPTPRFDSASAAFNTQEEVDYVIDKMVQVVTKLRELSPLYEMAKEGIDISKMKWQNSLKDWNKEHGK